MTIQTIAGVETERLQRAWQGYYRARRHVRQAKIGALGWSWNPYAKGRLRQAWTKLDQRQAHIIHRWYVEGWSVDEDGRFPAGGRSHLRSEAPWTQEAAGVLC